MGGALSNSSIFSVQNVVMQCAIKSGGRKEEEEERCFLIRADKSQVVDNVTKHVNKLFDWNYGY